MRFPRLQTLLTFVAVLAVSCAPQTKTSETPPTEISVKTVKNDKVEALMADMTLDEKLARISSVWFGKADIYNADGSFNTECMKEKIPSRNRMLCPSSRYNWYGRAFRA